MTLARLAGAIATIAAAPHPPVPWRDGRQIPWHDPDFSERMLRVHLDQSTQMASRCREVIAAHVRWLDQKAREELGRGHLRVLDVGCGPGLYCHELARRGYSTVGFDFAPAPLAYARRVAAESDLDCRFLMADLTALDEALLAEIGPVDIVTFWYGEFHSFLPDIVRRFLSQMSGLLAVPGLFVLEYQPYETYLRQDIQEWQACATSVFSDRPHLWLQEYHWDERQQSEINVHWIIDAASGELSRYAQCSRAYRDAELIAFVEGAGLERPSFHPPITGVSEKHEFAMLVARKA